MANTLIEDRKQFTLINRLMETEQALEALRTNQVHNAVTEVQLIVGPNQFANLQVWLNYNADSIKIAFNDWVYQNFYFECVMNNASDTGVHHTAEARMFDAANSAVFNGSTLTTTTFSSHSDPDPTVTVLRSGVLTKPSQTGTYTFNLQIGIDVAGPINSFVNVYMPRFIVRYEGG